MLTMILEIIKYIAKGLSMPLNSFNIPDEAILKQLYTFEKDEHIISVCSKCADKKYETSELTESDVESMVLTI